ncbi:ABC transporter substrate-binding protein [Agromyces bauzanensis]
MRSMRTTRSAAVAVFASAALLIAGCSATPSATESDKPDGPTVYIDAISADPISFNPQITNSPATTAFGAAVFDQLVYIDTESEIHPMLAKSWEYSDDQTTLTFTLEEGVTWHDGEPFTSEDVKFNFDEIMEFQTYGAALVRSIDSVEAPDDHTVVLHLNSQFGPFFETLALQAIVPKHLYEGTDPVTNPANMAPIGTGAMKFESFSSGAEVILVKNEDYWRGEVQVDKAIYPVMADTNTRALALISGEVDKASIDASQLDQIEGKPELVHLEDGFFAQAVVLEMNSLNPYLSDPKVRALVFSALDRTAFADVALAGYGEPADGFFPDTLGWAKDEDIDFEKDFPYDVKAINKGLDKAGFPVGADGLRFTLNVKYISTLTDTAAMAEQAKSMLGEVGIGVNLEAVTSEIFTDQIYVQNNFDLAFLRTTVSADPGLGIARWYQCNPDHMSARNPSGICDPEIDAAVAGANSTTDREERGEYFRDMQQRAKELIFFAPLVWTNASFPTVNTTRWDGLVGIDEGTASGNVNWLTMKWKG